MKTELKLAVVQTALLAVCVLLLVVIAVRQRNTRLENVLEYQAYYDVTERLLNESDEQEAIAKRQAGSEVGETAKKNADTLNRRLTLASEKRNKAEQSVLP